MGKRKVYTEEELAEIASGYTTMKVFRKEERKVYNVINKRGLIDKLCGHMKRERTPVGVLTKEHCRLTAQDYHTRKEFLRGASKEYWASQRHGWLDDICSHMKPVGNKYWRKIYVFTFRDGYAYVGLAQDPDRRYRDHTRTDDRSPVYRHIKSTGIIPEFELLTDWLHKDVASVEEEEYRKKYAADGWKMLNRTKCGSLGKPTETFYTHERLVAEISKYEYHEDFKKGSYNYYSYLVNHHLLKKYCSCLKRRNTPHSYWTLKRSIETAKKCKTRMELLKKYSGAYEVLRNAGLLKQLLPLNKGLPKEIHIARIKECSSRSDLYYKYQSTYNWAIRNNLLDEYFPKRR
jgi:predicted GIY-YIG superfamily endonuclease